MQEVNICENEKRRKQEGKLSVRDAGATPAKGKGGSSTGQGEPQTAAQVWHGLSRPSGEIWSKDCPLVVCVGLKCQALESLPCSIIARGLPGRGTFLAPKLGHCIWRLSANCIPCSQSPLKGDLGVYLYGCHNLQIIFLQPCSTDLGKSTYEMLNYSCHLLNAYQRTVTSNPVSQTILPTTLRVENY